MSELVKAIIEYGIVTVIVVGGGIFAAIFAIREARKKTLEALEEYRQSKNAIEDREDAINNRFSVIEEAQEADRKKLENLQNDLNGVRSLVVEVQNQQQKNNEAQKRSNRVQAKAAMVEMANEIITRGYLTEMEAETLDELTSVYMQNACINDSYVPPTIIQKALAMPIKTI